MSPAAVKPVTVSSVPLAIRCVPPLSLTERWCGSRRLPPGRYSPAGTRPYGEHQPLLAHGLACGEPGSGGPPQLGRCPLQVDQAVEFPLFVGQLAGAFSASGCPQ